MLFELLDDLGLIELPIFAEEELALQWHELLSIWFAGEVPVVPFVS